MSEERGNTTLVVVGHGRTALPSDKGMPCGVAVAMHVVKELVVVCHAYHANTLEPLKRVRRKGQGAAVPLSLLAHHLQH